MTTGRPGLRRLLAAASCAALVGGAVAQAADVVKAIRLYPSESYTRLVLELDDTPSYRLSRLSGPERLVLDVYTAGGDRLLPGLLARDLAAAPYLHMLRAARHDGERLRIVFDLAEEVGHSLFALEPVEAYGHRIVLDVSPVAREADDAGLLGDLGFGGQAAPDVPPVPSPATDDRFVVVIDAGHGGEDPGAVSSVIKLLEKDVVLDIARGVQRELNDEPGVVAHLTRDADVFLPLRTRVRIAHRHDADLFISIHADSFKDGRPRGSSVFVLSKQGASSRFARQLADQENLADMVGGINTGATSSRLDQSLAELFRDGKERASRQYAVLAKSRLARINSSHGEHVHSAGFAVLKSPSIPSALIEVGFLSNREDARLLGDRDFRSRIARQIAASVLQYRDSSLAGRPATLRLPALAHTHTHD